jgi:hypothetical protein
MRPNVSSPSILDHDAGGITIGVVNRDKPEAWLIDARHQIWRCRTRCENCRDHDPANNLYEFHFLLNYCKLG